MTSSLSARADRTYDIDIDLITESCKLEAIFKFQPTGGNNNAPASCTKLNFGAGICSQSK